MSVTAITVLADIAVAAKALFYFIYAFKFKKVFSFISAIKQLTTF